MRILSVIFVILSACRRKAFTFGGKGEFREGSPGVVAFNGSNNVDLGDSLNMQDSQDINLVSIVYPSQSCRTSIILSSWGSNN